MYKQVEFTREAPGSWFAKEGQIPGIILYYQQLVAEQLGMTVEQYEDYRATQRG